MLVCNYCKRNFKEDYKSCPGCGSISFSKVEDKKDYIIKTPPKGGYKLSKLYNKYQLSKASDSVYSVGCIIMFVIVLTVIGIVLFLIANTFSKEIRYIGYIMTTVIMLLTLIIGIIVILKGTQQNSGSKHLKLINNGILYKNLPYEVKSKKITSGDTTAMFYYIVVSHKMEDGTTKKFESDPHVSSKECISKNGTADLLVDPDDYNNYYVDLEIY